MILIRLTTIICIISGQTNADYIRACMVKSSRTDSDEAYRYLPEDYYVTSLCTHIVIGNIAIGESVYNSTLMCEQSDKELKQLLSPYIKLKESQPDLKLILRVEKSWYSMRIFIPPEIYYFHKGGGQFYTWFRRKYLVIQQHCLANELFDGILIDFNYEMEEGNDNSISNQYYEDLHWLQNFLNDESRRLNRPRRPLGVSITNEETRLKQQDISRVNKYVDYIFLRNDIDNCCQTQLVSPLYNYHYNITEDLIEYRSGNERWWHIYTVLNDSVHNMMTSGVPSNKIVISILTRKYGWLLKNSSNFDVGAPIIKNLEEKNLTSFCAMLNKETTKQYFNAEAQIPYLIYEDNEPYKKTKQEILYEYASSNETLLREVEYRAQLIAKENPNRTDSVGAAQRVIQKYKKLDVHDIARFDWSFEDDEVLRMNFLEKAMNVVALIENRKTYQYWTYENDASTKVKAYYIKEHQLGGAFIEWLNFEDIKGECQQGKKPIYPLTRVIAQELGNVQLPKKLPIPAFKWLKQMFFNYTELFIIGFFIIGILLMIFANRIYIHSRRIIVRWREKRRSKFYNSIPIIINEANGNERLTQHSQIGEGSFAFVHEGEWYKRDYGGLKVAIKTLRDGVGLIYGNRNMILTGRAMLQEAEIMQRLDHVHLLKFCGLSFINGIQIVTPLREMGNLKKYLKSRENKISSKQLLLYCDQISQGMEYLASKNIVHGDLAARNILIVDDKHIEVADFGLAHIPHKDNDDSIPIASEAWSALELLQKRSLFSEKTDVWSFGITCWEIFEFGQTPYANLPRDSSFRKSLIEYLENGNRLKLKNSAYKEIRKVLDECFLKKPKLRPKFSDIHKRLHVKKKEVYGEIQHNPIRVLWNRITKNEERLTLRNNHLITTAESDDDIEKEAPKESKNHIVVNMNASNESLSSENSEASHWSYPFNFKKPIDNEDIECGLALLYKKRRNILYKKRRNTFSNFQF